MANLVCAISGGVDSAVATARLLREGHEITAVHLVLHDQSGSAPDDAARVARHLGVPFEVWDLSKAFEQQVLGYFADEYASGRTPNPCRRCNQTIKFGALLDRALAGGFDGLATGHYAQVLRPAAAPVELRRAVDAAKDQSYVLAGLDQPVLRRVWLPLGGATKAEVRAEAEQLGLPVAHKRESMDLCFIPDGDTAGWLTRRLGPRPGAIVTESGETIGSHNGAYRFTIGQRKGLNVRRPTADGQPRYVIAVDASTQQVRVGPASRLTVTHLLAEPVVWTSGVAPAQPVKVAVQVRAHGAQYDATVQPLDDQSVAICLDSPIAGVAPGQAAVFYAGDQVVGSATINQTDAMKPAKYDAPAAQSDSSLSDSGGAG